MRTPHASKLVLVVCTAAALHGCGGGNPQPDAGASDTGPAGDTSLPDAHVSIDASHGIDAASIDAATIDAATLDAFVVDGGHDANTDANRASDPVPPFRHPLSTPDATLAMQALRILGSPAAGATTVYCNECHTLSRARIYNWRALSDAALSPTGCLNDLAVSTDASATAMVECIRASGSFTTPPIGVFGTGSTLPWFQYVFRHGLDSTWATTHASFVATAGMPVPPRTAMTADEFDIVAEWFIRGVPGLDSILPPDPAPTTCLPGVSAAVGTHVTAMSTTGWAATNRASGMLMYGCAGAATPADCLATVPLARDTVFGASWETITDGVPGSHLRVLFDTSFSSSWWTRASVDGRFVGQGAAAAPHLRFVDLSRSAVIGGNALYDPSWFPDGSGFMVQGSGGARVCELSVLTTGMPTMLSFTEPGCTSGAGIGLYEHVATSLGGADYWALSGSATYDNGGHSATLSDPIADWDATAGSDITHLLNTGTGFTVGARSHVAHPYEGDAVFSPTATVMLTRVAGPGGRQVGYVLRRLDMSGSTPTAPEIARYCVGGAKPEFSFDERFFVIHHYVGDADAVELGFTGASDPAFAAYRTRGAANVYLIDTTTGIRRRLTNMGPGQYALFPHFRSDGWIYMDMRTSGATPEHILASDAAIVYR